MYFNFDKIINGYIEDNNGSKYLTLILIDENEAESKTHKETRNKIKHFIELENNGSSISNDKYIKIRFNSGDNFPLKQELEMHNAVIIIMSAFYDNNNCYPQVFLY